MCVTVTAPAKTVFSFGNPQKSQIAPQKTQISIPQVQVAPYQPVSLFIHKIIGTTSSNENNFVLASDSVCIYHAQSFIVFYDYALNVQLLHYSNPNNKPYRSLAFDGKMLYAGEGGKQGEIHVFRVGLVEEVTIELLIVLKGHKYGI